MDELKAAARSCCTSRADSGRVKMPGLICRALVVVLVIALATVGCQSALWAAAAPSWSIVPSPSPGTSTPQDFLFGVSCASLFACTAVGTYVDSNHVNKTLVETWDGESWSVAPSPNLGPASYPNQLDEVSCPSADFCMSVGYSAYTVGDHPVYKTLAETWDGERWSLVPSPNEAPADNYETLDDVSCQSEKSCVAVGYFGQGTTESAQLTSLAEFWDGNQWSLSATPNGWPSANYTLLQGVSCTSGASCVAVGTATSEPSPTDKTLLEPWNGKTWSMLASPNEGLPGYYNTLYGVSCASPGACTAVGSYGYSVNSSTDVNRALVLASTGNQWSIAPSPKGGADDDSALAGVSCALASDCVAVGYYSGGSSGDDTLVESYNGGGWSVVGSPNPGVGDDNYLDGVSCPLVTFCVAVGYYHYGSQNSGTYKTLVEVS
jgi:hypothetical protein